MPDSREATERVVIGAIRAAVASLPGELTGATEVLGVVDSLGLMTALAEVQESLEVVLEPQHLISIFECRTIAEIAAFLQTVPTQQRGSPFQELNPWSTPGPG
jgi:acyl carrier protein